MMRLFFLLTAGILGFAFVSGSAAFADGKWKLETTSEYTQKVSIAGFLDLKNGITAGYAGEVHYSTNGGKTWPTADNNSWCRFGLEILDQKNAWTCGNKGHVRVSHDHGATWREAADFGEMEPNQCRYLSFADATFGWIASPARLAATTNGADAWQEITLPPGMGKIAAIHLLSQNKGYVLTSDGTLFFTKDGGGTWSAHQMNFNGIKLMTEASTVPTAALRFQNEKVGTLAALTGATDRRWAVLQTADGGNTWKEESLPDEVKSLGTGAVFANRDASLITITNTAKQVIYLLRRM